MNHLPTLVLDNVFPFETLFHIKSNYNKLKVFECFMLPMAGVSIRSVRYDRFDKIEPNLKKPKFKFDYISNR